VSIRRHPRRRTEAAGPAPLEQAPDLSRVTDHGQPPAHRPEGEPVRRSVRRRAGTVRGPVLGTGPGLRFRWWRGRDLNPRPSGYEWTVSLAARTTAYRIMPSRWGFACIVPRPCHHVCPRTGPHSRRNGRIPRGSGLHLWQFSATIRAWHLGRAQRRSSSPPPPLRAAPCGPLAMRRSRRCGS